jgi:L-lysine exporter family protein LysE/ArgO
VIVTTLALTWLNPHVYLDTVLLLGSIASTHGAQAWLFVVGALIGSVLWFSALGFGARHLGRFLSSARSWRALDGIVAVTMVAVAGMLAAG